MTASCVSETASRVGRKKEWDERITLPITSEVLARLDAAKRDDETRLDVIRQAIDRELKRREHPSPNPAKQI